jgi:hypothetical protein
MDAVVGKFWRELLSRDGIFSFTGVVLVSRLDDRSRMTRECHVRICGGLGGKFPGATRRRLLAAQAELEGLQLVSLEPALATFPCRLLW